MPRLLLLSLALAATTKLTAAEVGQSDDWLVSAGKSKAGLKVTKGADGSIAELSLENGLVQRAFTVRGGALCTTEYKNLVSEQTFFRAISPEANITLSGLPFDVGGCAGQPAKTMEFWTPDDWKANSRRREFCHFAGTPSPSLLKHLLTREGAAAE